MKIQRRKRRQNESPAAPVQAQFQSRPFQDANFAPPESESQPEASGFDFAKISIVGNSDAPTQPIQRNEEEDVQMQAEPNSPLHRQFQNLARRDNPQNSAPPPPIQAQLTVGAVGDKYEEEEADPLADAVVDKIPSPPSSPEVQKQEEETLQQKPQLSTPPTISKLQKKEQPETVQRESEEEGDEDIQMKPLVQRESDAEEEEEVQMKPQTAEAGGEVSADFESSLRREKGGGQPLNENLQSQMGRAMGVNFGDVRIHQNSQANQLNQSIQAKAFTTGKDIFFKQGEYRPESRGGQKLIAHELTHVVQQGGNSIRRQVNSASRVISQTSNSPDVQMGPNAQQQSTSSQSNPQQPSTQTPPVFVKAYVTDTAHLHEYDPSKKSVKKAIGKKLESGNEIDVFKNDEIKIGNETWIKAKDGNQEGYIRRQKILILNASNQPITDPDNESTTFDEGVESAGGVEEVATNVEEGFSDGLGQSIPAFISALFGMTANIAQLWKNKKAWENFETLGTFGESLVTGAAGGAKAVDSGAKFSGKEGGVGESEKVANWTEVISDGLSAVKNSALAVIGWYKLYRSKSDKKGQEATILLHQLTGAAHDAANVAKTSYDIMTKSVPSGLLYTIPGISIAMSAINLLIRGYNVFKAGKDEDYFSGNSSNLKSNGLKALLEDSAFEDDKRGVLGGYKYYKRVKKEVLEVAQEGVQGFENLKPSPSEENTLKKHEEIVDKIGTQNQAIKPFLKPTLTDDFKTKGADDRQKLLEVLIDSIKQQLNPEYAEKLEKELQPKVPKNPSEQETLKTYGDIKNWVDPIQSRAFPNLKFADQDQFKSDVEEKGGKERLDLFKIEIRDKLQQILEYQFVDKMSEINRKRKIGGWQDIFLELLNMAGDITSITTGATGVGLLVGQSLKAGSAGAKAAHGGAKWVEKAYRNKNKDNKRSSETKHKEYVGHVKFIFGEIANLENGQIDKAKNICKYIQGTGVDMGLFWAEHTNPNKQAELLVEAMKKR